ncbi:hypothetical protein [Allobranchiibius sp. CTAmp26]|uniref:hypothetical protein n=1 Tax=Allobranchiibius sp. CTAmp26 TaxID=2815214 RepID=UPI001AA0EB48|nr:hypothetical protein [Allobranchiibius sp. CTAmp26]MBO1754528.1 hypothetical protein [Allobranchiibius sp. CTAmp26]
MHLSRAAAVPALLSVALVAGCNNSSTASSSSGGAAGSSSGSSTASSASSSGSSSTTGSSSNATGSSGSATGAAASCPSSNTRSFAKTRFVTDIGLTVGTFHRWIWKPYKAGTFNKGSHGRIRAIVKGAAVAGLDLHLMNNAKKNVEANPTLCKVLAAPIENAVRDLGGLKGKITSGDFTSLTSLESTLSGILTTGNKHGLGITESTDESKASQG